MRETLPGAGAIARAQKLDRPRFFVHKALERSSTTKNTSQRRNFMQVTIFEAKTGKVIGIYPIFLSGLNYTPTEEEYLSEAWNFAVEDKLVDVNNRAEYSFRVSE
jgi:hypothetical protein